MSRCAKYENKTDEERGRGGVTTQRWVIPGTRSAMKKIPLRFPVFCSFELYFMLQIYNLCEGVTLIGKVLRDFLRMKPGSGDDSLSVKLAAKLAWGDAHLAEHSMMGRKRAG